MEFKQFEGFKYVVRYPENYNPDKKCPVLLFLHGAGTRGDDLSLLTENLFFKITKKYNDFPFVTIAPQCPENTWFDMFEQLKRFVLKISTEDFTDNKRIYLMGSSMGGYGTWQLAMSMPELFAAIVPICGGGMYWNAGRLVNVPVWAFHGEQDMTVRVEESVKMVEAVNKRGGNAKLTIYPDRKHDSWTDTYSNYEVFEWLLSNKNENASDMKDEYNNSDIYG